MMIPVRGAVEWQEVAYADLPEAIQRQYNAPAEQSDVPAAPAKE